MENMVSITDFNKMQKSWMMLVAFLTVVVCLTFSHMVSLYFTSDYEYLTDSITNTNTNTNTIGGVE